MQRDARTVALRFILRLKLKQAPLSRIGLFTLLRPASSGGLPCRCHLTIRPRDHEIAIAALPTRQDFPDMASGSAGEKPRAHCKKDLQICETGGKSRKRPIWIAGKKPNGEYQLRSLELFFYNTNHSCLAPVTPVF
jgi:hypothetical protein